MKTLMLTFAMLVASLNTASMVSAQQHTVGDISFDIPSGWSMRKDEVGTWYVPGDTQPNEAYLIVEAESHDSLAEESLLSELEVFATQVNEDLRLEADNRQDPFGLVSFTGMVNADGVGVRLNVLVRRIGSRVFIIAAIGPESIVNGRTETLGASLTSLKIAKSEAPSLNSVFGTVSK